MSIETLSQPEPYTPRARIFRDLLGSYFLPLWPRVLGMSLLLLAGIALQLASPQIIRFFLDTAQAGGGTFSGGSQRALLLAAATYILFSLGQQGLSLATGYASQVVGWSATNRLRTDLTLHTLRLDMPFHKRHSPGAMIERIEGDVEVLANFFSAFIVKAAGNILLVAGILVLLIREDARVGAGLTAYALVVFFCLHRIQQIATPRWIATRQAASDLSGYLEERIAGTEDIRAVGAEDNALQRLTGLMHTYLEKNRLARIAGSLSYNLTNLLYVTGYAAGLGLGAYLFLQGDATLGTAYLIIHYIGMLSDPLQTIREQADDFQQAAASIGRIQQLLALRPVVGDAAPPALWAVTTSQSTASSFPVLGGPISVEFDDVSFRYEDHENVLEGVSFHLEPGRTLGVLGRTGSGKTTLTRLLFRLYDPSGGSIRFGMPPASPAFDLRDIPMAELRSRIGLVTQDVQLFQASVRDNLAFFDPAIPDGRLEDVLRELALWDWVVSLPHGLSTVLGAGSHGLSAGEAQLLAFARIFLKDPGLVVLDEASSRLDPVTETRMERAIDRLFAGRTGLIIAHRLGTIQRADDILILEQGRVIETGRRVSLAADPTSYYAGLLRTGLEEALA